MQRRQSARKAAKPWRQTASYDGIHLFEFQNKLRAVFVPLPANNVVSFSIVYLVGSNAETSSQYGSVSRRRLLFLCVA